MTACENCDQRESNHLVAAANDASESPLQALRTLMQGSYFSLQCLMSHVISL
jgi:hypothetical protein